MAAETKSTAGSAGFPDSEPLLPNSGGDTGGGRSSPSVLVIGAGIAGIQTSLDVANAGFQVYLVERSSSIGGHMAQLDKTSPTLDCSSCILTPRMSEISNHPLVELLPCTDVTEGKGTAGDFHVSRAEKPERIRQEKNP